MGELYLRKVILDIFPQNGASKRISDLRIKFQVGKLGKASKKAKTNDSKIEVFNLSDDTRKIIENKTTRVALAVGYLGLGNKDPGSPKSNVEQIFIGNVTKVVHHNQPPDIVTEVKVGDGDNHHRNARHTKGYPPNTRLKTVLNDCVDAMQLNHGSQDGIPDRNYPHGITVCGLAKDHLDQLTDSNGLEWSIQDETIQIIPKNGSTSQPAIIIGPDSGMVGSPDITLDGIEFACLIQPKLKPGGRVQIKSHFVSGEFIVKKVEHNGDSHYGDFVSKVQAVAKK